MGMLSAMRKEADTTICGYACAVPAFALQALQDGIRV